MTIQMIWSRPLAAALGFAVMVSHPWMALVFLAWKRIRKKPTRTEPTLEQQALAARIVLVGLTAGLPLRGTLELAAGRTQGEVAAELTQVVRRSRQEGIAQALTHWSGPCTSSLLTRLAMATASGAPMLDAVASYLAELRLKRRTEALDKARRLPVTLMIPLGLLILPGFVLLFVGPVLIGSLTEVAGSLPT
jgi:type II secretory pathway component PulF